MSLTGSLHVPDLVGVVQLVCLEGRAAHLRVREGARAGSLYFADGKVVHAEFEDLEGEPAFQRLIGVQGGAFELEYGTAAPRETITRSVQALLLDACRRRDEGEQGQNNGLGSLARAAIEPGLARGLVLVEKDGTVLSQQDLADPKATARLIALLVREAEGIGELLRLGAIRRAWVHAPDGRCLVVAPHGPRWVGIDAEGGPAGRRLEAALDQVLGAGGGRGPAAE